MELKKQRKLKLVWIIEKYILALKKKCLIVFIIINIKNNIYNMVKIFN